MGPHRHGMFAVLQCEDASGVATDVQEASSFALAAAAAAVSAVTLQLHMPGESDTASPSVESGGCREKAQRRRERRTRRVPCADAADAADADAAAGSSGCASRTTVVGLARKKKMKKTTTTD
ncbi:unnamed protein product [Lampetra fluviatilis]